LLGAPDFAFRAINLPSVVSSPPGTAVRGKGHTSLGVGSDVLAWPMAKSAARPAAKLDWDVGVLSNNDISAEFSIVGSRLPSLTTGTCAASPVVPGVVQESRLSPQFWTAGEGSPYMSSSWSSVRGMCWQKSAGLIVVPPANAAVGTRVMRATGDAAKGT
jgi:hypothetical protein